MELPDFDTIDFGDGEDEEDFHLMDKLEFVDPLESRDCSLDFEYGVIIINCPRRNFIYNAKVFVTEANRAVRDYGSETSLTGI